VVSWQSRTSAGTGTTATKSAFFKDTAHLQFGRQRFVMKVLPTLNVIRVDVECTNTAASTGLLAIHTRLKSLVGEVISECMKSLQFITALPYDQQQLSRWDESESAALSSKDMLVIPLDCTRPARPTRPSACRCPVETPCWT
jgi:hypothetical protein